MMKQGEFYRNFAARDNYWSSNRTGKNNVLEAEESGFRTDGPMMPYEVYHHHAPFENIVQKDVIEEDT